MKLDLQLGDLDEDSLDLTPLIDVLFLLLAFFIIAASFAAPAMDVRLAKAENLRQTQGDDLSLIFNITGSGEIFYGQRRIEAAELKGILSAHNEETPIVFNVDQGAPFDAFMTILDEAKGLGRQKFLINGRPKGEAAAP